MKITQLKVSRIGNSRGIRLSAALLKKYRIGNTLLLEERPDAILLKAPNYRKLSWAESFKQMAMEKEDWSEFDVASGDGIHED